MPDPHLDLQGNHAFEWPLSMRNKILMIHSYLMYMWLHDFDVHLFWLLKSIQELIENHVIKLDEHLT